MGHSQSLNLNKDRPFKNKDIKLVVSPESSKASDESDFGTSTNLRTKEARPKAAETTRRYRFRNNPGKPVDAWPDHPRPFLTNIYNPVGGYVRVEALHSLSEEFSRSSSSSSGSSSSTESYSTCSDTSNNDVTYYTDSAGSCGGVCGSGDLPNRCITADSFNSESEDELQFLKFYPIDPIIDHCQNTVKRFYEIETQRTAAVQGRIGTQLAAMPVNDVFISTQMTQGRYGAYKNPPNHHGDTSHREKGKTTATAVVAALCSPRVRQRQQRLGQAKKFSRHFNLPEFRERKPKS